MTEQTLPARTPWAPRTTSRTLLLATLVLGGGLPAALFAAILFLSPLTKPAMVDAFVRAAGRDPATWAYTTLVRIVAAAVLALVLLTFAAVASGITVWWEMRVSSRMQSRIGYNRAGAGGFFQWIADAMKLLFKEDLIPAEADQALFRASPYFVFVGFGLTFVALPFGESLIASDLNVGIFYITAVTALVVVGILLAGWSSNSKWALFGGMRSAAQVVSYEIPAGLGAMVPVLMAGTLSMQELVRAQGAWPWDWAIFRNPFALVGFLVFFVGQLAESNRPPFDLPEAESELVAGYLSEYSGFRYAIYFLVEFANVWVMSAIAVTLFFGGWQVPFVSADDFARARGAADGFPSLAWWGLQLLSMVVFAFKTLAIMNLVIWIRWTLPRVRVDQMMGLCWKYMVPAGFLAILGTLLWQIVVARLPGAELVSGIALTVIFAVLAALFLRQSMRNISIVVGDKVDLSNW
jgi:NADH-quinone oxidoreductase subunit H